SIAYCLLLIVLLGGCKKWIDVKPSDRLTEDQLFSTRQGYLNALNGIYIELTNPAIYGDKMSVSNLDVMAQYYVTASTTHKFYQYATFDYTAVEPNFAFDNMWKKAYELIINCNVIIDHCGDGNDILTGPYFGLVKGEALALRAMLHLDMLRLFGPIYTQADKDKPCIPYNTASRPQSSALLGSAEVMQHIIEDLNAAEVLLKDVDPVITDGVRNSANASGNNDLQYRQYRMNYYAVKALRARAYLWMQNKAKALEEAKQLLGETLNPAKPIFPLGLTPYNSGGTAADLDHMFRSEVLFGLYTINRQNLYNTYFSPEIQLNSRLSCNEYNSDYDRLNTFMFDDHRDLRENSWISLTTAVNTYVTHVKFSFAPYNPSPNLMPLIRMGEILLMAAECSNTLDEGKAYLNQLRTARFCVDLNPTNMTQLKDFITREFRKEVIGEGQMFFYYKRSAMTLIPSHTWSTGGQTKTVSLSNYVVPLPVSEVSIRGN
ncbi:MAG TPA: RagB/SusD family nutrient uptake outer membrane protein, partial [Niastella sp.]|nr:RagB/SusD family nutrient uptake outer membrane protein [Niastella sp.]